MKKAVRLAMEELTLDDLSLIIASLSYSMKAFREYQYPSNMMQTAGEFQTARIEEARAVKHKVSAIRQELKK